MAPSSQTTLGCTVAHRLRGINIWKTWRCTTFPLRATRAAGSLILVEHRALGIEDRINPIGFVPCPGNPFAKLTVQFNIAPNTGLSNTAEFEHNYGGGA